ncbi:MAG TPA: recombinase family protein [Acidimicrobiales bacterium]
MSKTVAYVRVSTEDQVDFSPEAQAKRCRELARLKNFGPVTILSDEGWSAKNLDRPKMRELLIMIRAGEVEHLLIWSWDRLSRDQGDFSTLVKLFNEHGVKVHSVNEGHLDLASASGRMQIGVQGVFAQYQRDHLIENTLMGQRQAHEQGRWLNRSPTGYDMINGYLMVNTSAPLVQRVFELRASGASYPIIAEEVGLKYSTARHICENRVYLGEVLLSGNWCAGIHAPLVTLEQFNAAQRPHQQGRRRGKDLLSGRVRCGLCGQAAHVKYNDRSQPIYKCWHRGEGCKQSGRSAHGLHRAVVVGLRFLREDKGLQAAICEQLGAERQDVGPKVPAIIATLTATRASEQKLFDLYVKNQVNADFFAEKQAVLRAQMATLESQLNDLERQESVVSEAISRFDRLAGLLNDLDIDAIWAEANNAERKILVQDLVDEVRIYPDRITVQVAGAPPIIVMPEEVGLRPGSTSVVSETGLEPTRP